MRMLLSFQRPSRLLERASFGGDRSTQRPEAPAGRPRSIARSRGPAVSAVGVRAAGAREARAVPHAQRRRPSERRSAARRSSGPSAPQLLVAQPDAALVDQPARLRARDPEHLRDQRRQVDGAVVAGEARPPRSAPARRAATNTRSNSRSACAAASSRVQPGDELPRQRALGVARRRAPRAASARGRAAAGSTRSIASSGIAIVLPYISCGASVTPMWLPSDFDILRRPSMPTRIGIVRIACSGWP